MKRSNTESLRDEIEKVIEILNKEWSAQDICDAALAEPPRNCDVGSVQEQRKRFDNFCKKGKLEHFDLSAYCAYDCPCGKSFDCKLAWAQRPYKKD